MIHDDAVVHVVDDDAAFRESVEFLVKTVSLEVKSYSSASEFIEQFDAKASGCIIVDVRMPIISGLELQDRIRRIDPETPVIFLTAYADVALAVRAMKSGAFDFLEKPVGDQVLLDAIHLAIQQDQTRRQSTADSHDIIERFRRLTSREMEVLELVVEGLSSKEIATQLHVSFKTVEAHRSKIMKKTEATSLPHLVRMRIQLQNNGTPPPGFKTPHLQQQIAPREASLFQ